MGFPGGSDGKESACNAGELGSIPGYYKYFLKNQRDTRATLETKV